MKGTTRAAVVFAFWGLAQADIATAQSGPPGGSAGSVLNIGSEIKFNPESGYFYTKIILDPEDPELLAEAPEYLPKDTLRGIADALGAFGVDYRSVIGCGSSNLWATSSGLVVQTNGAYRVLLQNVDVKFLIRCRASASSFLGDVFFGADDNFIYVIHSGFQGCFDHVEIIPRTGAPTGSSAQLKALFFDCVPPILSARTAQSDATGTLFLGFGGAGVYRSTDGGHTWSGANTGLAASNNYAWVFVRSGAKLLQGTNQGIYASSDDGTTWAAANGGIPGTPGIVKAMDVTGTAVFAGVNGSGVFKSTNDGASWQPTGFSGRPDLFNSIVATTSSVYAATNRGLYVSADGGTTFNPVDKGRVQTSIQALVPQGTSVIASTSDGVPSGVFTSPDRGLSWSPANPVLDGVGITGFAAAGNALVGVGYSGAYRSTDAGATWARMPSFPSVIGGTLPVAIASGGSLFASNWFDLYRSLDNGVTWAKFNGNLNRNVSSFGITSLGTTPSALLMGAGSFGQGVVRSLDGGNTWTTVAGFQAFDTALCFASSGNTVYAANFGTPRLYRSNDSGATFASVAAAGITSTIFSLAAGSNWVLAGTQSGLFWSTDGGATFTPYDRRVPGSVRALALSADGERLYAGTSANGVWTLSAPGKAHRFVPVVLDVVSGSAHFTTELSLTNRGTSGASLTILYTSSLGAATGSVADALAAGRQLVIPDVIAYLRQKGLSIPVGSSQVGTLQITFDGVSGPDVVAGVARTTSATQAPQPPGAAGLAYAAVRPGEDSSTDSLWVYGLRQNATDRSNVAVYNPTPDPVTVKVTAYSGDGQSAVVAAAEVLPGYGWKQYNGIMNGVGNGSGYTKVERVSSTGAFGTYGVINDNGTNDGSFVRPVSGGSLEGYINVPVLVETSAFVTEILLANRRATPTTFQLVYTESLSPSGGTGGTVNVTLQPGEQRILPNAIAFLRANGAALGAPGAAYAGSLHVSVPGPLVSDVFVGARTASPSPAGGQFGLFYSGNTPGSETLVDAYVYGLRSDANNRSNVAILNVASPGLSSVTLSLQAFDGDKGGSAAGSAESTTLQPGQWTQYGNFLAAKGVSNGWVHVSRTAGSAPWITYGVINDGGAPGQRTGDGAFVTMVK